MDWFPVMVALMVADLYFWLSLVTQKYLSRRNSANGGIFAERRFTDYKRLYKKLLMLEDEQIPKPIGLLINYVTNNTCLVLKRLPR